MSPRCVHPLTVPVGTRRMCSDCGADRTPCETCITPGLKPKHKAPIEGHPDHCGCPRCFG